MFTPKPMPTFQGAPNWGTEIILAEWGQTGWDIAESIFNQMTEEQRGAFIFEVKPQPS